MGPKLSVNEMLALVAKAEAAGRAAGDACVPVPMHVVARANPLDDHSPVVHRYEPVMDGVCGFAGIVIRPGNCALANYLKRMGKARENYGGGVYVNVREYGQSMARKEAYANAYAEVLRGAGFERVYVDSRMD